MFESDPVEKVNDIYPSKTPQPKAQPKWKRLASAMENTSSTTIAELTPNKRLNRELEKK